MFGQPPSLGNLEPQVAGFLVLPAGNTSDPYPRGEGEGVQPIGVPAASVDLWFALSDDETATNDLGYNKVEDRHIGAGLRHGSRARSHDRSNDDRP